MLFVGDDWSEEHHDVWVMGEGGEKLASCRFAEGVEGLGGLLDLLASFVDDITEVVVGIETDRGLWVNALVAAGAVVYPINPRSVARYRERHHLSGAKSDRADAKLLADLVRTDRHNHRRMAGDSDEVEALKVLARAHQNLIWERKRHVNRLRSALREYYPQALSTFDDLADRDSVAVLAKAPTPIEGAGLTTAQIRKVLSRGGRQRNLDKRASEIQAGLTSGGLDAPAALATAFGVTTAATVAVIAELNRQIGTLSEQLKRHFDKHPDAPIYHSMPGLGFVLGARVLGEFGDDPERYLDAKCRRNCAATSPVTIASGKGKAVAARWIKNNRLYDPLIRWAFCSLTASPGARAFYDQHRGRGKTHYQALRALANRLVGILHGCLKHQTLYDEEIAWGHRQPAQPSIAA